jgi:hypothetical protein
MKHQKGFAGIGIIVAIVAILAVGGVAYYVGTQKNITQLSDTKIDCAAMNLPPDCNPGAKEVSLGNLVGNDKDEHGCIGSAGYTWCELKNKCLRTWEEKCEVTLAVGVAYSESGRLTNIAGDSSWYFIARKYDSQQDNWLEESPIKLIFTNQSMCQAQSVKLTKCTNFSLHATSSGSDYSIKGTRINNEVTITELTAIQ